MGLRLEDLPPKAREQIAKKQLAQQAAKAAKYHNVKAERITEDGKTIRFDSQKEARRFDELLLLLRQGMIRDLRLQPEYTLQEAYTKPDGIRVRAIKYVADFSYVDLSSRLYYKDEKTGLQAYEVTNAPTIVEDVKSEATKTRVYAIKRKLMLDKYGITIREV